MSDFSPQERQRLISMYTTQYNQTNLHINRLFNTLDDIRHNLNTLINNNMNNNNNMNRQYRLNRPTRLNQPTRQTNAREGHINSGFSHVYYDYANPIERSTYINNDIPNDITNFFSDVINNTSNMDAHDNNPIVTNFLTNFLNSVPIRPTEEQINSASSLVRYSDIQTPNSLACAISLETFEPTDTVRQLHHCRHIFFPEQFNQWFSNNVRCPVCRHDIRSTSNDTNVDPVTNIVDISNNDNLLTSITNRFLVQLFNPSPNNTNEEAFETIHQYDNL